MIEYSEVEIWFVYDGECPICHMAATMYKVQKSVGNLHIIDARVEKNHPLLLEIKQANMDLDMGMVIKHEHQLYHGSDALALMADIGSKSDWFNKLNRMLFQNKLFASLSYPIMKTARNIALKAKRVGKIRNLDQ